MIPSGLGLHLLDLLYSSSPLDMLFSLAAKRPPVALCLRPISLASPERVSFPWELNVSPQVGSQILPWTNHCRQEREYTDKPGLHYVPDSGTEVDSAILEPNELSYRRLHPQRERQGLWSEDKGEIDVEQVASHWIDIYFRHQSWKPGVSKYPHCMCQAHP